MESHIYRHMQALENHHWWFLARRKIIAKTLALFFQRQTLKILDAGCGNGDNLSMLLEFGPVSAMEKEPQALEYARARNICEVYSGELPNAIPKQLPGSNDLIVLLDVLEHIDDDSLGLNKLKSLLTETGHVLITVPAYQFMWSRHDDLHHHKRRYTKNSLKRLLEANGFEVSYISYFNTLLFPLALIDRLGRKLISVNNDNVLTPPPRLLNWLFLKIFSIESLLVGRVSLPYGLSVIALARKEGQASR